MDEQMTNDAVVEEQVAEETETELSDEEFDAIWDSDDDDDYFVEQAEPVEADQPDEQPAEPETKPEEPKAEPEDTDQYLELKHFDEIRKVSKDEAKALAQKGLDYDRIRGRAEADSAKVKKYEDFFNEIKGDFGSIDDMMVDTLARVRSEKEGKTYEEVKAQLLATNQQQVQQPKAPTREQINEIMRRESLTNFLSVYPNVKADSIPKEVWDDMKKTNNLVASYAKYEAKKLADENKVLKQNATNKVRSTGSMKSSGNNNYNKNEFDKILDDDDY